MVRDFIICLVLLAPAAFGQEFTFDTPSDDRWHYPFNFTPGGRPTGSCFGAAGIDNFNDRDGIVIVAWDTSSEIPTGLGPDAYHVSSVRVTVTIQANENINPDWPPDPTVDEWFTYDLNGDGVLNGDGIARGEPGDVDGESNDVDAGRPIALFGAGFGPTHSYATWTESSAYVGADDMMSAARDPFPFVFQDTTLALLHVEDNVSGLFNEGLGVFEFTPTPWAVGAPFGYTPGAQSIPFDVEFEIDLNLAGGEVRRYVQGQLNDGRVFFVITSLREIEEQGPSNAVPSFYMKEGVPLDTGAKAAALTVTLAEPIPTTSAWGMLIMLLALVVAGAVILARRTAKTPL